MFKTVMEIISLGLLLLLVLRVAADVNGDKSLNFSSETDGLFNKGH